MTLIDVIDGFPHCDQLVLHAPGECEYCDMHPDWQELRTLWGLNYTGHHDPGLLVCPAEQARDLSTIHRWVGNSPNALPVIPTQEEISRALDTLQAALSAIERMDGGQIGETPDSVGA